MPDTPRSPATLKLIRGRERSLLRRHPWIYSGSVAEVQGEPAAGEMLRVCADDGRFLAWAAYSPASRLRARVWSFDEGAPDIEALVRTRLAAALDLRDVLGLPPSARRVAHGESDGLPGVVIDRYGDQLVLAANSAGGSTWRGTIARIAAELCGVESVYERSEGDAIQLEGLPSSRGALLGAVPAGPIAIEEHGLRFRVDVQEGHKTGFYLDQRENRALVRSLAADRDVLDCFSYTGGFAIAAAAGGARSVVGVDSSEAALARAAAHAADNGLDGRLAFEKADVFRYLRSARDARRSFDMIVLDPPKLAPTARHAERASRAYKDINLLALKLLRPGGLLLTFSCSAGIGRELFAKIIAGAAVDAGIDAVVAGRLSASGDHPVSLHFPEGDYLKGLMIALA